MRSSKKKSVRTCQSVFLVIALLAFVLIPETLVSGSDVSKSARASLRQANLGDVPLVDAVTPKPDMAGKSELYIDAEYYKTAARDVTDFVCLTAREGRAIVVVGSGLEDVCHGLSIGYDKVFFIDDKGTKTEAPILAGALKLYPDHLADGVPFAAQFQVCGRNMSIGSAMNQVRGFLDREAQRTFKRDASSRMAVQDGSIMQVAIQGNAPYYAEQEHGYRENLYDGGRQGDFLIKRSYQRLYNDASSTYDWKVVKHILELVPGYVKNNMKNGWRNDWTRLKTYPFVIDPPDAKIASIEHCPTTTVGSTSVSGTVGVTAGTNGAGVTAAVGVCYSLPDVVVHDYSQSAYPILRFELQHQINEKAAVGKCTYQHSPAVSLRLPDRAAFTPNEYYRCQWACSHWYGWTHITSPWINIVPTGL